MNGYENVAFNGINGLGGIMLSQISQTEYDKYYKMSFICAIQKIKELANVTKKKHSHRHREQTSDYQQGERRKKGQYRGGGLRGTNYYV